MGTTQPSRPSHGTRSWKYSLSGRLRSWLRERLVSFSGAVADLARDRDALPARLGTHLERNARGYIAALIGVAAVSLVISFVQRFVHVSNISLLYLFVVLWLAATFGRAPAILASLLAFLAYDFFFIPPLYRFNVDDPAEWVSLSALLVTALVIGQLTATVEAKRREAVASQQRTATLYALAQVIASATGEQELLDALVLRVVHVFAGAGVEACALMLPDGVGGLSAPAVAPDTGVAREALALWATERRERAQAAMTHGRPAAGRESVLEQGVVRELYWRYVPLQSGQRIVGVLTLAGSNGIRRLRIEGAGAPAQADRARSPERRAFPRLHQAILDERDAQAALFAAFCDQIALALERAELRKQAIHAEALRESDRLKTALLGSVTHDLRTPLASIKAATTSLLQLGATWSETDRRELLRTIDTSVDRLNRLVSNLLDLSRLEAGAATPEKDWYLIGDVVATVLSRLELSSELRDYRVEVDIPHDLPLVPMDYAQMEEVFTNLLENAMKYSPVGSVIRVSARVTPAEELEVRVADQGIGIPFDELQAIFDRFYRVQHVRLPWASRPPIGTGLGLAICAGIIRAHGGRIWAESILGKGATLIFTLPVPKNRPTGSLPEVDMTAQQSAASAAAPSEPGERDVRPRSEAPR